MSELTTMGFWRRLAASRWIEVGALLLAVASLAQLAMQLPSRMWTYDFAHYYVVARLLSDGGNPYTTNYAPLCVQQGMVLRNEVETAPNPPLFYRLFAPLAKTPLPVAFGLWTIIEVASLIVILALTRRLLDKQLTTRGWRLFALLVLSSVAVCSHFYFAQVGLLLATLVLAAYWLHTKGKSTTACMLVTMAGLLKLYPFVLLPWFIWRGGATWRGRVGRLALALGLVGAVVLATGPELWRDFSRYTNQVLTESLNSTYNYNLPSWLANLGYARYDFAPPPVVAQMWALIGPAIGLGLIALAFAVVWWRGGDREAEFCLLCVAMLAGSVRTWGHYFVFLIFPSAVAVTRVAASPSGRRVLVLALILTLLNCQRSIASAWLDHHLMVKVLANYLPLYGLLGLGLFFVTESDNAQIPGQRDT